MNNKFELEKEEIIVIIRVLVSTVLAVLAQFLIIPYIAKLIVFITAFLVCAYDVALTAIKNIFKGEVFDEHFLMTLATAGAFATEQYIEAVALMIFYQVGELFQDIAVERSKKSIEALGNIRPDSATVLRNGKEISVSPKEIKIGETIIVKAGERIALDGFVSYGESSLDCSALTGESLPVDIKAGDRVSSGCINLKGLIRINVTNTFEESTVAKILKMVEDSSEKKAKAENFIKSFARVYTPLVVIGALLLAVVPSLFTGEWVKWLNRALIFLVVSCPCALVVSVPLSFFGGIGGASKLGILIKGANYLETLSKVDTVVFDKTGTLTRGKFAVEAIHPDAVEEAKLLDIAAVAESYSNHPIAESLINAHNGHIDKSRISSHEELSGMGICAVIDGETYYVGNDKLMDKVMAPKHDCHLNGTIIHISKGSEYLGHIVVNDEIKPESKGAIERLKALGISKTVMLTGDRQELADSVAKTLVIDEAKAKLLPQMKLEELEKLISEGRKTLYVGDGINDAPVLTRADIGVAMGKMGSDVAIEAADVVLMDDKLTKLADAVAISRRTMKIVKQNIVFALSVKLIILLLGAFGFAGMWIALFGDVGVTVIAVLNAVRALNVKERT